VITRVNRFMQEVSRLILTGASFLGRKLLLLQETDFMKSLFSKVTKSMQLCNRRIKHLYVVSFTLIGYINTQGFLLGA